MRWGYGIAAMIKSGYLYREYNCLFLTDIITLRSPLLVINERLLRCLLVPRCSELSFYHFSFCIFRQVSDMGWHYVSYHHLHLFSGGICFPATNV